MHRGPLTIEWAGEELALLPERAVWWARTETLFIADPHFGKAATFRLAGLPVPERTHDEDLHRLGGLIERFSAKHLVILGDFFHARAGRSATTMLALAEWRRRHAGIRMRLVVGNHDRQAGRPPDEWNMEWAEGQSAFPPFSLIHEPMANPGANAFVVAGHWHPSFRLSEGMGSGVRLPCFYFGRNLAVLPAFGNFTGTQAIAKRPGDRIFVTGPESVLEIARQI